MLLLHNEDQQQNIASFKFRSQVFQPASAGEGADMSELGRCGRPSLRIPMSSGPGLVTYTLMQNK